MRPFIIDLNNLSYSKETLIYYSRAIIGFRILIIIGLTTLCINALTIKDGYILSLILFIITVCIAYNQYKFLKRINEVQFRINSKGIQYRNENLISWNNIENERVITEGNRRQTRRTFIIYYIISEDRIMKIDIAELSFYADELKHTLTIHRNRFIRESNIPN
jgi:uncharacterized membrane protein YbhN (UPF0104 family)